MFLHLLILKDYGFTSRAEISRIFHKVKEGIRGRGGFEPYPALAGKGKLPALRGPLQLADFPRNHPAKGHFVSTFGAVHQSHSSQKTKKPLSQQRDKGNILCGTTLLAGQTRPATQVLPGNGGVRRGLLKFSPLLQGDVPRLLPSALHLNGGSLCVSEAGTFPFPRGFPYLPEYLICFLS